MAATAEYRASAIRHERNNATKSMGVSSVPRARLIRKPRPAVRADELADDGADDGEGDGHL
jgi:hypothetical protein